MVVCRCRKATKLYCFVHKVPVCGECISFADHRLCVVKTYSDWVIDGDYDWPPKCGLCQEVFQETEDVTRLGCFHILHSSCLETHLRSFPPHTAPAGYTCPTCSTPIWPPKLVRDSNSVLHTKLKEVISKSGLATTLLGSDLNVQSTQKVPAPPAFSSSPLVSAGNSALSSTSAEAISASHSSGPGAALPGTDNLNGALSIGEVTHHETASLLEPEASSSSTGRVSSGLGSTIVAPHFTKAGPPLTLQLQNGAMARKNSLRGDVLSPSASGYDDDEDGSHRKYSRRGPLHQQLLRSLVPFWSPSLPTLPVTAPHEDKHSPRAEDLIDGRPRRKHRHVVTFDARKLLLWFAIISCMATVLLLYYRLAQDLGNNTTVSTQGEAQ